MNEENNKNKYVTEEYSDQRLGEHSQVILSAMDAMFAKYITEAQKLK